MPRISDRVPLTAILERYGVLSTLRRRGNRLIGTCPIHRGTRVGQFVVTPNLNAWHCFGDCKRGAGTIGFVAAMENISNLEAAARIADWFALSRSTPSPQRRIPMGARPSHKVLSVTERGDGSNAKPIYRRVGSAWPIKNGGFSIQLDALPVSGRLVVMTIDDDQVAETDDAPAKSAT